MDFLRTIASAALQSTGVSFPFTIGDRIPGTEGKTIWDIREGVKKVSLESFCCVSSNLYAATLLRFDADTAFALISLFVFHWYSKPPRRASAIRHAHSNDRTTKPP